MIPLMSDESSVLFTFIMDSLSFFFPVNFYVIVITILVFSEVYSVLL